jgi:hypothetical protein
VRAHLLEMSGHRDAAISHYRTAPDAPRAWPNATT